MPVAATVKLAKFVVIGAVAPADRLSRVTTATVEPLEVGTVVDVDVDELELFVTTKVVPDTLLFESKCH